MLKNIKASLLTVLFMVVVVAASDAATKKQCNSICRNERETFMKQCIEEERDYWENITESELIRQCKFITYYGYVKCVDECLNPNKQALKFYDESVKNFPLENMSAPIEIDEGETIPKNNEVNLQYFIETFINVISLLLMIALYLTPSFVVGWTAYQKGYQKKWMWFVLFSAVFTPILGFLAVIALPSRRVRYVKVYKG